HGPMFIGFVFNVFLYGIMITQVYLYFTAYKQFVIFLLAADTANTIFDAAYLYRALIVHFGAYCLNSCIPSSSLDPALTGIIAGAVQLFFAWRLRVLTHSWALASIVVLGALSGLAGAVATSFEVGKIPQFVNFRDFKGVVIMWLVSESVTDIIITSILVWYLLQKHKTGFKESDYMVDRIIRITVQTGLVTSIAATLDLILFLAFVTLTPAAERARRHLIFNFPLCKLYSNSLMSSLNARGGWRYGSSKNEHTTTEVTSATPQASLLQMRSGDGAGTGTGILHALGHALGGAPTVPAVPAPGDAPRLPKRAAWGPLRRFSTGTYHHYARGEPVDAAIDAGASTPSHSRSLGAGLLRATSLSRPVSHIGA
ncbi:hypothetical protein HYPSUDRAFT_147030, partial [Hypholoma sublateritium FD-334 SS-4]